MRQPLFCCLVLLLADLRCSPAWSQGYPSGAGGRTSHEEAITSTPIAEKPDKAAMKAYNAGLKSMAKAHEQEQLLAAATDPDKRGRAREKLEDAYQRAIEQFTEVLRNKEMYDAWNQIGYIHLHLGAYRESVDDYNHALTLKPDLLDAIQNRGQAYLGIDRLDEAKAAYMDLFFHSRPLADQLMASMQAWLQSHQKSANGMRAGEIDAFGKWLQERDGIAKTTASNPAP
jgi:tetratricopeptide (TPR) repeat protein